MTGAMEVSGVEAAITGRIMGSAGSFFIMKIILIYFFIVSTLQSCSGGNAANINSTNSSSQIRDSLPFKALHPIEFIPGKQSDIAVVLKVFKAWENNDMKVIKANFTDSVELFFPTGDGFKNSIDSFIKIANSYFVDSLNKKEIIFYSWMTDHSVGRNEDWVRIWYKEIDSYKNGRVDSIELQDDNLMKNGKIEKVYSHMRKLGP
jgi:hypothetical protein